MFINSGGHNLIRIMKRIIVALVMVVFLSQLCHAKSTKTILDRITKKERLIGMTEKQIKKSFGKPTKEITVTVSKTRYDQWIYGANEFLNFKNGRVTYVFIALSN